MRLTGIGWIYLGAECLGLVALGGLWVITAGGLLNRLLIDGTYAIQRLVACNGDPGF